MNQKGIIAIAGLSFILAAIIVIAMIAVLWLFFKQIFFLGLGAAILWFGLIQIPKLSELNIIPKKSVIPALGISLLAGGIILTIGLSPALPFSLIPTEEACGGSPIICWKAFNRTISETKDFEGVFLHPYGGGASVVEKTSNYWIRFSINGQEIERTTGGSCAAHIQNDCEAKSSSTNVRIPLSSFSGFEGIQVVRIETQGTRQGTPAIEENWTYLTDLEMWIDSEKCIIEKGKTIKFTEEFIAGDTITTNSLRYVPLAFCSDEPLRIREFGKLTYTWLEGYQILQESYITVPPGQSFEIAYVAATPEEIGLPSCDLGELWDTEAKQCVPKPLECEEGQYIQNGICKDRPECEEGQLYDLEDSKCVDPPIHIVPCSRGEWDYELMACKVQPTDCINGTLVGNECIYNIPEAQQQNPICPEGSRLVIKSETIKTCIYTPYTPGHVQQNIPMVEIIIIAGAIILATILLVISK